MVRFSEYFQTGLLLIASGILLIGCSGQNSGSAADYVVRGNVSAYEEQDSRIYKNRAVFQNIMEDGIHDPEGQEVKSLQEPAVAMKEFPVDRRGLVNWAKAIDQGIINPRASRGGGEEMNVMDMDILLKNTAEMPWVRFPHLAHTRWLDCSNCHPAIFIPQRGANKIGMDAIIAGEYCGRCHDKVAFALWTCERCHSVPHEGSPKAWWRKADNPMPPSQSQRSILGLDDY